MFMGTLFGTDGIRGEANQYPINCQVALLTGKAVGIFVSENGFDSVIIGKDTRQSGDMLESALAAGVASTGIDVKLAGVIPTPGVAFLSRHDKSAGAGIVISASHNPYQDNGIKIFKHGGVKLSDEQEAQIENFILKNDFDRGNSSQIGRIQNFDNAEKLYADFLKQQFLSSGFDEREKPLKIVIDASNGAASDICKSVFAPPWFNAEYIHHSPDGTNINKDCGSQHTEDLKQKVTEVNADIGLAFDGDADRLIVVDEKGQQITGDCIMAICAKFAVESGRLDNRIVVSTIMSNVGLTEALNKMKIEHAKAGVGDRKVLEEMVAKNAVIGGEDSGHMIFLDRHSTGDGMLSALMLLEVLSMTGQTLSQLARVMTVYPQVLMNVEVDDSRPDFTKNKAISEVVKNVEDQLGDQGRVLIRYSGTQPLLRVMVEGPDQALVEKFCKDICESVKINLS